MGLERDTCSPDILKLSSISGKSMIGERCGEGSGVIGQTTAFGGSRVFLVIIADCFAVAFVYLARLFLPVWFIL